MYIPVGYRAENALHHGQVFSIVVSLEESHAEIQFEEDAADRPDVTRLRPTQLFVMKKKETDEVLINNSLTSNIWSIDYRV